MSITVNTDSYITIAEATTILEDYFDTDNFDNAVTADQEKALKQATRNIDSIDYLSVKYDSEQLLSFPRNFISYAYGETAVNTVNDRIKTAQALEALKIMDVRVDGEDGITSLIQKGIKSQSIEGTSVTFTSEASDTQYGKKVSSDEALEQLEPWILKTYDRC